MLLEMPTSSGNAKQSFEDKRIPKLELGNEGNERKNEGTKKCERDLPD
jgi:hypothetical protein